jgi:2-succinyl-5-enolpyruvyl-6-hydroxy-3-cyclohexene-1-carboxylate synthase
MKKVIFASAVMAMFAASAMAAEEAKDAAKAKKPEGGKMFEVLDINKDTTISKEEWLMPHDKKFSEMDANKDGKVVVDEVKTYQAKQAEAHKAAQAAKSAAKEAKDKENKDKDKAAKDASKSKTASASSKTTSKDKN